MRHQLARERDEQLRTHHRVLERRAEERHEAQVEGALGVRGAALQRQQQLAQEAAGERVAQHLRHVLAGQRGVQEAFGVHAAKRRRETQEHGRAGNDERTVLLRALERAAADAHVELEKVQPDLLDRNGRRAGGDHALQLRPVFMQLLGAAAARDELPSAQGHEGRAALLEALAELRVPVVENALGDAAGLRHVHRHHAVHGERMLRQQDRVVRIGHRLEAVIRRVEDRTAGGAALAAGLLLVAGRVVTRIGRQAVDAVAHHRREEGVPVAGVDLMRVRRANHRRRRADEREPGEQVGVRRLGELHVIQDRGLRERDAEGLRAVVHEGALLGVVARVHLHVAIQVAAVGAAQAAGHLLDAGGEELYRVPEEGGIGEQIEGHFVVLFRLP